MMLNLLWNIMAVIGSGTVGVFILFVVLAAITRMLWKVDDD